MMPSPRLGPAAYTTTRAPNGLTTLPPSPLPGRLASLLAPFKAAGLGEEEESGQIHSTNRIK
jgi:hypothetical protein